MTLETAILILNSLYRLYRAVGEGFKISCPDQGEMNALQMAELLRQSLINLDFGHLIKFHKINFR